VLTAVSVLLLAASLPAVFAADLPPGGTFGDDNGNIVSGSDPYRARGDAPPVTIRAAWAHTRIYRLAWAAIDCNPTATQMVGMGRYGMTP
jgi:hypothetical protein